MENQGQIAAESRNMNRVATVREKSGKTENFLRSGKIFDIVKVSEKSGNSVFRFTVHKFSFTLKCFFFRKKRKICCKSSKAIDTICLTQTTEQFSTKEPHLERLVPNAGNRSSISIEPISLKEFQGATLSLRNANRIMTLI